MGVLKKLNDKIMSRHIPFSGVFELTSKCNLGCDYCYVSLLRDELSFDEITSILNSLASAGTMFLTLTGGEVFLRDDFLDIVRYARKKGFALRIFTNGTLMSDDALALFKELSGIFVSISIHGKDAATNDAFTKSAGSFDKIIDRVKKCKELGIPVRLKCTWTEHNIPQYNDIHVLADSLDVPLTASLLFSPKSDGTFSHLSCKAAEEKMAELIHAEYSKISDFQEFYDKKYKNTQSVTKERGGKHLCAAGISLFRISADGSLYPCVLMQNRLGNLKEESFDKIWSENEFLATLRNFRRKDVSECQSCEEFNYCFRCLGITQLEGGDMFSRSNEACLKAKLRKNVVEQLWKEVK